MSEKKLLKKFQKFIDYINEDNSKIGKLERLKEYKNDKDIAKLLKYTLDNNIKFSVTKNAIEKYEKKIKDQSKGVLKQSKLKKDTVIGEYESLYDLLDDLANRKITGNKALQSILDFTKTYNKYRDLILLIINKKDKLKIRMGEDDVNKVFEGLTTCFSVALAYPFDKYLNALEKDDSDWYISRKLDGARCITIVKDDQVRFYSRTGLEFFTLGKVSTEILKNIAPKVEKVLGTKDFVLDGEICIIDDDGNEDFKSIMKVLKKKDLTIKTPMYCVFDCLTYKDFIDRTSINTFSKRYKRLSTLMKKKKFKYIKKVEQVKYNDAVLEQQIEKFRENDWEGLILRKDTEYVGKRSSDVLKVKDFSIEEFKVIGYTTRYLSNTGKNKKQECLDSVKIQYKGKEVLVASGFDDTERVDFFNNPDKIMGKVISVRYFEESTNKKGEISLRHATYRGLHGKKRVT